MVYMHTVQGNHRSSTAECRGNRQVNNSDIIRGAHSLQAVPILMSQQSSMDHQKIANENHRVEHPRWNLRVGEGGK